MKKILIALTNTPTYGEKHAATGLWLGEAAEFVDEVGRCRTAASCPSTRAA